jgi:mRNA interferase RelE/StbE
VSKYKIVVHKKAYRFLLQIKNESIRNNIKNAMAKLENYPFTLKEMDVTKIRGLERTFRVRIGNYRIIFYVEKTEKTIYVTHIETRGKAYKKLA